MPYLHIFGRVCIIAAFTIYVMAGQELFKKRHQLRAFNVPSDEQNFPRYKPSDIHVTTDFAAVPMGKVDGASTPTNGKADTRSSSTSKSYDRYTVNISSVPFKSRPSIFHNSSTMSTQQRRHKAAMEANRAAFGYTKVALLFFVSLLVTWVSKAPSPHIDLNAFVPMRYQLPQG